MKKLCFVSVVLFLTAQCVAQKDDKIFLIIRGDDIGSCHTSNLACIQSFREGIVRSVEVMVPGPWFPEAVRLLEENPGLDVGVHLVLTSEWSNYKWRPLTYCPSLVDADGYFYPMIWQRDDFPEGTALHDAPWKIEEIEKELRAQIETAKKYIPRVSHMDCHMGCTSCAPQIRDLVNKLAAEYNLNIAPSDYGVKYISLWNPRDSTLEQRLSSALKAINGLGPGKYLFVDHPGMNTPEMQAIGHTGYMNVAADRDAVTRVFTSPDIKAAIEAKGIHLMSYAELKKSDSK